jgi:hypothetical protein
MSSRAFGKVLFLIGMAAAQETLAAWLGDLRNGLVGANVQTRTVANYCKRIRYEDI